MRAALGLVSAGIGLMEFIVIGIPAILIFVGLTIYLFAPVISFFQAHWVLIFVVTPSLFVGVWIFGLVIRRRVGKVDGGSAVKQEVPSRPVDLASAKAPLNLPKTARKSSSKIRSSDHASPPTLQRSPQPSLPGVSRASRMVPAKPERDVGIAGRSGDQGLSIYLMEDTFRPKRGRALFSFTVAWMSYTNLLGGARLPRSVVEQEI
jgi:hypothetical protein